jgi:hypothetical protein
MTLDAATESRLYGKQANQSRQQCRFGEQFHGVVSNRKPRTKARWIPKPELLWIWCDLRFVSIVYKAGHERRI